jgi:hypothetical protein
MVSERVCLHPGFGESRFAEERKHRSKVQKMTCPFPGIDPYLELPVLLESVRARQIFTISDQLLPKLYPRYVTSIEQVFIEERPAGRKP